MECTYNTCLPVDGVHNILAYSMQEEPCKCSVQQSQGDYCSSNSQLYVQLTRDQQPVWHELRPKLGQSRTAAAGGLVQASLQNRRPC